MLVDTSGWLCLYDQDAQQHERAVALYDAALARLTTNYILAEYTALAHVRGVPRADILQFSALALADAELQIIWVEEPLHRQAVELMQQRPDKNYSLCDAVSFVVMRERGWLEALTTDKHFEQEGFVRLLTP